MNIYKVGNNLMALSQKQVENLINKRDNYDIGERHAVESLAKGNCLDIGANIGYFTVIMGKSEKVNHVYAFEPDPDNFNNLKMNIAINDLNDKVSLFGNSIGEHFDAEGKLYKC